jgi:hypothetical protein
LKNGWFVEDYKFAYHWSFNLSKQLCTDLMDIYPGFVFRPYVYENGSCSIMIDPKFRFEPKKNLRNIIDEMQREGLDPQKINSRLRDEFVIDACPITECGARRSPSANCQMKGVGKRRKLLGLDFSKKPSTASIGNLIEYHRKQEICQYGGKIADAIRDDPPIGLVRGFGSRRVLEYPVERIRRELKLWDVDKYQRMLVMKYIQPPMPQRYKMTENFAACADELQIGHGYLLKLNRSFAEAGTKEKPWEHFWTFEIPPLRFGKGFCSSQEPYSGLEKYGPYDISGDDRRQFSSINLMICNLTKHLRDDQLKLFYNNLVEGFERPPPFKGLKRLFGVQVPSFSEDLILSNLEELDEVPANRRPHVILVFASSFEKYKIQQYGFFKKALTKKGIATQFILEDTLRSANTQSKYVSYLKNVALGIYYKVGGIPWVLGRPPSHNVCYIGLAASFDDEQAHVSTQGFDSIGLWLGGWTDFVEKGKYSTKVSARVTELIRLFQDKRGKLPDRVFLHKEGEIWSDIESKPLEDEFGPKLINVSIKKTPLPRMYDHSRIDYSVTRGSCIKIDQNIALLATTGLPLPVHGSQRPITVETKALNITESAFRETCETVFNLSLLFGGYILGVISKPITTHFASQALSMANQYDIAESSTMWRKAWFV